MARAQRSREPAEQYTDVVARTWQDEAFKQQLVADPAAALGKIGISIPAGKTVRVVEDTANTVHVVLPARPAGELSDEQLTRLAGEGPGPARKMGHLLIEAWQDEAFKQRLAADPRTVLLEHGLPPPDGKAVRVLENTADTVHLVLPVWPVEGELSDEQLEQVAGGLWGFAVLGVAMLAYGIAEDSDWW